MSCNARASLSRFRRSARRHDVRVTSPRDGCSVKLGGSTADQYVRHVVAVETPCDRSDLFVAHRRADRIACGTSSNAATSAAFAECAGDGARRCGSIQAAVLMAAFVGHAHRAADRARECREPAGCCVQGLRAATLRRSVLQRRRSARGRVASHSSAADDCVSGCSRRCPQLEARGREKSLERRQRRLPTSVLVRRDEGLGDAGRLRAARLGSGRPWPVPAGADLLRDGPLGRWLPSRQYKRSRIKEKTASLLCHRVRARQVVDSDPQPCRSRHWLTFRHRCRSARRSVRRDRDAPSWAGLQYVGQLAPRPRVLDAL